MRRISLIAGAVATGLLLAACGGGGGNETKDVEVFTWWTEGGEKAGLDGLVGAFKKKYPDYKFVNAAVAGGAGSNAKNVLASRLQSGEPPSSFQAHAGGELSDYIKAGQLQDLTSLYQEEGWDNAFPPGVVDMLKYKGKIYSVPANVHRANVVWANPNVLKKARIGKPATSISAWIDDLEKLKKAGVKTPLAIATDWTQVHLLETVLIADLGPEAYTGLWNGKTDWKSAEVTKALEDYKTLLSYTNTDRSGIDWPDAAKYVTEGRAAYTVMGDWVAANFQLEKLQEGKDWIWHPVPGTDGVFDFLADSFTLPVGAPNPKGAKSWLKVVGSADGQKAFNTKKGSIPVRTDAKPEDFPPYQQEAMKAFSTDTIVPSLAHGAAASVGWLTDITSAVGEFGSNNDVAKLQKALDTAAKNNLKKK
ncbi:MAG: ABC transporter substrate-binding protein [Micromonosporaceae bacterium]